MCCGIVVTLIICCDIVVTLVVTFFSFIFKPATQTPAPASPAPCPGNNPQCKVKVSQVCRKVGKVASLIYFGLSDILLLQYGFCVILCWWESPSVPVTSSTKVALFQCKTTWKVITTCYDVLNDFSATFFYFRLLSVKYWLERKLKFELYILAGR